MCERFGTPLAMDPRVPSKTAVKQHVREDLAMTAWERRMDRGLGYLGLFLIGSISWLADNMTLGRRPVGSKRRLVRPTAVASQTQASARAASAPRTRQRAA